MPRIHSARSGLLLRVGGVILTLALLFPCGTPSLAAANVGAPTADEHVNQAFFSQAAGYGEGFGYVIADIADGPQFYTTFQDLGGNRALGYPLAAPFVDEETGDMYLVLQRAVLVWHRSSRQVSVANVFEILDNEGLAQWLLDRGIPGAIQDDGGATFRESRAIRLSWLSNPDIYQSFLQNPLHPGNLEYSILLYGLPMSRPERTGPFIVQRFQRAAFQYWVESVPGQPAPGTVTQVFAGDLFKEANLIPLDAFRPEPNPFHRPSDKQIADARALLATQPETAYLAPRLDGAIVGYAPDLLDIAAVRVGTWVHIYLNPALADVRYEAVAAVLAHLATYLHAQSLSPVPFEHTRATCERLMTDGLRTQAALWEGLWGPEGTYNAQGYEQILNGYVRDAQRSANWAELLAQLHCA